MCPSYQVTLEEKHTTRGRARILWEMLNGGELDLWRSREVYDALDLCLSCKGCTHDCPVSVDMPTLKAEFLSHHYKRRLRPRAAYAFGLIDKTARLASKQPALANAFMRTPVAKLLAGAHPEREFPEFAPRTLARLVPLAAAASGGGQEDHPLGRHLQQPLPSGSRRRRGRGARGGGLPRRRFLARTSAAAGRSTTTGCSTSPSATSSACSARFATRSAPARRSSASSRAASRC